MRLALVAAFVLATLTACASAPPQPAVDAATAAVTKNPAIAALVGEGYTASYLPDESISSASLGTRVEFRLSGSKAPGHAHVQLGLKEPWDANNVEVTVEQHTHLKRDGGQWKVEDRK